MMAANTVESKIRGTHPYAEKFPMLAPAELDELRASIDANGLRTPIVVDRAGLIIDGRNRNLCCDDLGIEPDVVVYDGDDIAEYVIDCNVTRRNMSTGARAMATALVLDADGRRNGGRWRRGSVVNPESGTNEGKTWQNFLNLAGVVLDHVPRLADQVVSGDLALDAAYNRACEVRDAEANRIAAEAEEARQEAEAETFITENAPDLAGRVDGTDLLTFTEALSLWRRRNKEEAERIAAEKAAEERKQREIEQGRRDTCTRIAECVRFLDGGKEYADIFLRGSYPYEAEYLPPGMRLTRTRIDSCIEFLQTIRNQVNRD